MGLKYDAQKGDRFKRQFTGFFSPDPANIVGFWNYNLTLGRWEPTMDKDDCSYSSHAPCKTVKAFRRMLKKAPAGVNFVLVSKFVGFDVQGTGSMKMN